MSGYKVEICGVNTARLPLLSSEEKEELFQRILEGDQEAREQYIKGNLRLVLSVIQRFSSSQENIDDLFQIGCIGLIKAIDNFDIRQNVKFSTYAVPMTCFSQNLMVFFCQRPREALLPHSPAAPPPGRPATAPQCPRARTAERPWG